MEQAVILEQTRGSISKMSVKKAHKMAHANWSVGNKIRYSYHRENKLTKKKNIVFARAAEGFKYSSRDENLSSEEKRQRRGKQKASR